MTTTTPTPREQALTDLMQPGYAHSGEYLPDQLGDEERSLPTRCPSWCSGGHAAYMHECRLSVFEASEHSRTILNMFLDTLRNPVDGLTSRRGGGHLDVRLTRRPHPLGSGGYNGPPLVEVMAGGTVELTTGEARSLAAALIRAADLAETQ